MKVWTALACAVLLCQVLSGVTAQQCANPDCAGAAGTVIDLGASFKTLAAVKEAYKGKILLTKFFAPWCGHCKKMAPAWVDLAKDVKDSTDVVVSEVDCTVHKDLCAEAGVRGYPTILAFKDGSEPAKHSGARDVAGFKAWIEKLSAPPAEEKPSVAAAHTPGEVLVLGDDSFKATTALPKLTLVKMFAPWCGHCKNMAEAWVELAKEVKDNADIVIAEMDCTTNEAACEAAGVEGYPTIKAFKAGKDLGEHEGARDVAAFKAWINKLNGGATEEAKEDAAAELPEGTAATLTPGEVLTLGDSTFKATSAAAKLMVVKMYAPWCGHCKRMAEAWVELAKEMKDNADVVVAEVDCTTNEAACKAAGVRGYPTILAFKQGEQAGKHSGSRDLASLKAWVEKLSKPADAAAADDKPSVAATATPGEVLVLTDADFKGTIAQADKLVAVKMFAPWCGHCKKMAEAWVELAKEVKDNANVVIAEVDCTVHQAACEAAGVEGYPTIKAFKAGKDLGEHEGARDLASLKKFIEGKL